MSTLYEYFNTVALATSYDYAYTSGGLVNQLVQTFTPQITHEITSVKLGLEIYNHTGDPGNITVEIFAVDGSFQPTGSALATVTIDGNGLVPATFSGTLTEFTFVASTLLTASTMYAIVVSSSTENGITWFYCDDTDEYLLGNGWGGYDYGNWYDEYGDFLFEEYGNVPSPVLTFHITADSIITATRTPVDVTEEFDFDAMLKTLALVPNRMGDYDPDKFWDEETQAWSSTREISKRAGGRNKEYLIVVGCETIYVGGL